MAAPEGEKYNDPDDKITFIPYDKANAEDSKISTGVCLMYPGFTRQCAGNQTASWKIY
jgi:hypothetical protein